MREQSVLFFREIEFVFCALCLKQSCFFCNLSVRGRTFVIVFSEWNRKFFNCETLSLKQKFYFLSVKKESIILSIICSGILRNSNMVSELVQALWRCQRNWRKDFFVATASPAEWMLSQKNPRYFSRQIFVLLLKTVSLF